MTTLNDATPEVTVVELEPDEAHALFERACREHLNVDAGEFLRYHDKGAYPPDWPAAAIQNVEFLLPFAR